MPDQDFDYSQYRLMPIYRIKSSVDPRDYLYGATMPPDVHAMVRAGALPSSVDLHALGLMPDPWDQGQEGSCTGHGHAGAMCNSYLKAGIALPERFSPRYIYWQERVIEGTTSQDAGAEPRDGCDALVKLGVCVESKCPYVPGDYATAPPAGADADAAQHKALKYEALAGWQWICQALGQDQRFIPVATLWFNEWFNPPNGELPLVSPTETPAGGHEPGFCGYAYDGQRLRLRMHNSYGKRWGDGTGHAWIQADHVDQYISERWAITSIAEGNPQPQPKPETCRGAALALAQPVVDKYAAMVRAHPRSTTGLYGLKAAKEVITALGAMPEAVQS